MWAKFLKTCRDEIVQVRRSNLELVSDKQVAPDCALVVMVDVGKYEAILYALGLSEEEFSIPVRYRSHPKGIHLVEARFGQKEKYFSSLPPESGSQVMPCRDIAGEWEIFRPECYETEVPDDYALDMRPLMTAGRMGLEFWRVDDGLRQYYSGTDIRNFLCLQDEQFVDGVCRLIAGNKLTSVEVLATAFADKRFGDAFSDLVAWIANGRPTHPSARAVSKDLDDLWVWPGDNTTFDAAFLGLIRTHVAPQRSLCIVATARNEGAYLLEWIAYHQSIGVEAFFIYANDNDDSSDRMLSALNKAGIINYFVNEIEQDAPAQYKAYSHAFKMLPDLLEYRWALIIDIDEFFGFEQGLFSSARDVFEWADVRGAEAVAFNWQMFNVFGQTEADLRSFVTQRCLIKIAEPEVHIKCACKPRLFEHSHCHYPWSYGGRAYVFHDAIGECYQSTSNELAFSANPRADFAWINHYWAKSGEELMAKLLRNSGDMPLSWVRDVDNAKAQFARIMEADQTYKQVEDLRMIEHETKMHACFRELLEIDGVREAHEEAIQFRKDAISRAIEAMRP